MLPIAKSSIIIEIEPTISARKSSTVSICRNGANEVPRYQEMVGTGLPEEKQAMLTKSPSCTVTVPFRFMMVGAPADMVKLYGSLICMFRQLIITTG